MKKMLVFHRAIAPYRIDFFNDLCENFNTEIYFSHQEFRVFKDYEAVKAQSHFIFHYLPLFKLYSYFLVIKKNKPDIILTNEFNILALFVVAYKYLFHKKYKIVTLCDDSGDMLINKTDSLFHKFSRILIAPFLDDIIVNSHEAEYWYRKKYKKGFYFPIIIDDNKARKRNRQLLNQSNSIIEQKQLNNKRVFLFVGRLVVQKNVTSLLTAFSILNQHDNVLVIIGDGVLLPQLKKLCDNLNINVFFAGRLEGDNLWAWYNIADIFVLPSIFEPFGAVVNEALLSGCFSIVSKKAGASCLILHGNNGLIFDPSIQGELEYAMQQAITYLHPNCSKRILRRNLMSESYADLFLRLKNRLTSLLN